MTKPRVPRVEVNGKEYNMCPICGGPCTIALWRTVRRCIECNTLIKKGHSIDETKAIRLKQLHNNYKDKISNLSKPTPVKKERDINFRNIVPKGITVKGNNSREASILVDYYNIYLEKYGHLPEFNLKVNDALFSKLQAFRIEELLSNDSLQKIEASESLDKKTLKDGTKYIPINLDDHKRFSETRAKYLLTADTTIENLKEAQKEAQTSGGNLVVSEFQKALRFHHEQGQYFHAVGVCTNCNHRIILKTEFPTFLKRYNSVLEEMVEEMRNLNYDNDTLDEILNKIKQRLDNDSFVDTYVGFHVREMEKPLK